MTTTAIYYEPADVPVADDRGTVRGAWVVITWPDGERESTDIIPPEGDSPDCWLGDWGYARHRALRESLERAARNGAEGRRGEFVVETPDGA